MTLNEAIKHAEEVTEENNKCAEHIRNKMKSEIALNNATECETCADEHRQLAEWLKDYKRLLEQNTVSEEIYNAEYNARKQAEYELWKIKEQQSIAEERYQDLVNYFGDKDVAKCVLKDREEFKKWLKRIKWYVQKADELARKLEQQSEDYVSRAEVLKQIKEWKDYEFVKMTNPYYYLEKRIQSMPPVIPTHGTCKDCEHWKDSDGVYRRGVDAESKCPINTKEVYEGNFYCKDFKKRGNSNDMG